MAGKESDVHSDAVALKPLYDSNEGIAVSAGINPAYSKIDTYHMTACAIDEAIRRVIAVGGSLKQIALNDNFCWPSPLPSKNNPDAKYKLAQLVRANEALKDYTMAFKTPCVSGKDSVSLDGTIKDKDGKDHRLSVLPTIQFSAAGRIDDVEKCVTMDVKKPGDIVYVLGRTYDELGGSEYYEMLDEVGLNVPKVNAKRSGRLYKALSRAVEEGRVDSIHGCYKGGLGVALAQASFAGGYGLDIDLRKIPKNGVNNDDKLLYSESAGRFVVTVVPENREGFESMMKGSACRPVGYVTNNDVLNIKGVHGKTIMQENIHELKKAYKQTFGV
jgi:phosphoribosylformylglycinamidine synthase